MLASWSLSAIIAGLLLAALVEAEVKPSINTTAEYSTECKTCPRSLCSNARVYERDDALSVSCWTRGTKIMGDNTWLKTDSGCYITQYDVLEYEGDYITDLAYCGRDSEEQNLTIEDAETKYKTECSICPTVSCDTVAYLAENTELELTCWTPDGLLIIDDPIWLKTTNNCYVAQKNLYSKPDITYLEPCGPIPHLEIAVHNNENGTSEVNKRDASESDVEERDTIAEPVPELADRGLMYLVNVTVGEEYAHCRKCPSLSCQTEKIYEFNQELWLQCLALGKNGTEVIESDYWSQTTDFCYVHGTDLWESLSGDFYRFPRCELFPIDGSK
ncbi:hypothetical protein CC86DRAFT_402844 [Ophiobolus disseminans]|uniref:Cyanovirin-N domain-containing protein n=1 Tax=Ophiobolus disseminans TaxID=1469910 RepID=A0A6A7ABZ9_9PLEO|nr:hypothetical protein CC86DRAFT_402844 [Ophiobolus disseminans]